MFIGSKDVLEKHRRTAQDKNDLIYLEILNEFDSPRILDCDSPGEMLRFWIQDGFIPSDIIVLGHKEANGPVEFEIRDKRRRGLKNEGVEFLDFDFEGQELHEVIGDKRFDVIIADGILDGISVYNAKKLLGSFVNQLDRGGILILVANAYLRPGLKIWKSSSIGISDPMEAISWIGRHINLNLMEESDFNDQAKICFVTYFFRKV